MYGLDWGKSWNWHDIISDISDSIMIRVLHYDISDSTMTHTPHYDIVTPPCSIYSLTSEGECPLECSSFVVLQILRSIPLSSILYLALRIRPLTLFPSTKVQPQLQDTSPKTYQNISPCWPGVILRAFSASSRDLINVQPAES